MANVTAILSMLHEPALPNSATRMFHQAPVLSWTLRRLAMAENLGSVAVICWDDQFEAAASLAAAHGAHVFSKGPREIVPLILTVAAARRWADGWRGGLLATCDFDLGFYAPCVLDAMQKLYSDAVILIDPSAGLVDPKLIDRIIDHADSRQNVNLFFTQAAPGLAGVMLRPALVDLLVSTKTSPGRLLNYLPDSPTRDPISGDGCVPVPTAVARTTRNFRLDSDRRVNLLNRASNHLNGELVQSGCEDLLQRLNWTAEPDSFPKELVLEVNTTRSTAPIFWPGKAAGVSREPIRLDLTEQIFAQLSPSDDVRITFSGVGDPLLHPMIFEMISQARKARLGTIHIETDLLPEDPTFIAKLVESQIDVVSVHLPAMTAGTYAMVMGTDRFLEVLENIQKFVTARQVVGSGLPLLVPIFTKCAINLAEMESWYDQWLKPLGSVVVREPSDFGGLIDDCGVADMSPPKRKPCVRLGSRMNVLANGLVVSCEQDVSARQVVGDLLSYTVEEVWKEGFSGLRQSHAKGCFSDRPLCAGCREWHRP